MAGGGLAAALARLDAELVHLRTLVGREDGLNDPVALPAAKFRFVSATAAAADACARVISIEELRSWGDPADAFRVLAEQNRLSVELTDRLLEAVALRDRLVRGVPVDDHEFVAAMGARVDDFDRFRAELSAPPDVTVG